MQRNPLKQMDFNGLTFSLMKKKKSTSARRCKINDRIVVNYFLDFLISIRPF